MIGATELAAAVHKVNPRCIVTSDANRLHAKVGQGRLLTTARASWEASLRASWQQLVDEIHPHLKEAWDKHQDTIVGSTPTTFAIMADEKASRRQDDLFG